MKNKTYFAMALDPIHIGTGGYRLGRVDNTIVREPGTNLPKVPGTSIEGNARTYAYYKEREENDDIKDVCAVGKKVNDEEPCGHCPICITFGFTMKDKSFHGMAQFSDARILLFPVHSMFGPVWVTCPSVLKEWFKQSIKDENKIRTNLVNKGEKLNLGWLYLENENNFSIHDAELNEVPEEIKKRSVLISDKLFSHVVNSNLEVRTSVSIDPRTGAAEKGALFTYEAIPRATVLWFDVVFNNPENFDAKLMENDLRKAKLNDIISTVKNGLGLFETLGIGGMQTRGFGRLRVLNLNGDSNGSK